MKVSLISYKTCKKHTEGKMDEMVDGCMIKNIKLVKEMFINYYR